MGGPDNQPQPALGAVVRALREKRGLTQEGLAQAAGLTTGTVSLIERGQSNPAWGTVKALAAAFEVSMGDLGKLSDEREAEIAKR
jgi:transcriptional regulator with XRE-family HTH domain